MEGNEDFKMNESRTEKRNTEVRRILEEFYTKATDTDYSFDESQYLDKLNSLFTTAAWGFREILLVIIVGMKLDSNYKASTGFYECKPRAIYETQIKEFLIKKNIPHRQSGPLNIAKATVGINEEWASQRRPKEVAQKVVELTNALENKEISIDELAISLLRRLINETTKVEELSFSIEPNSDPDILFSLCKELIINAPDAGNTPQKIGAFVLKNYHLSMNTGIIVTGEQDRASVTSTTSKKPGDINEENANGEIYKVYEITVKHFDLARIRDSYATVTQYNTNNNKSITEIIVICRKEDCPKEMNTSGLHSYLGNVHYKDIIYYYWDIFEWVSGILQKMPSDGRIAFYNDLNNYISNINTSMQVKNLWFKLHNN